MTFKSLNDLIPVYLRHVSSIQVMCMDTVQDHQKVILCLTEKKRLAH